MCVGKAISSGGLDEDVLGFGFAEREVIAADFYFQRITQWRSTNECDRGAYEQAHFAESEKSGAGFWKLAHRGGGTDGELRERDRRGR